MSGNKKNAGLDNLLKFTGEVVKKAVEDTEDKKFYVEGYASSGGIDSYDDKISEAALKQLAEMLPGAILLHNHDPNQQLGIVREAKVEGTKVWVSAEVMDKDAIEKIQDGRLNAFSIYAIVSEYLVHNGKGEYWYEIVAFERVVELSLTSVPAQDEAVVTGWTMKSLRTDKPKSVNERAMERFRKGEVAKGLAMLKSMESIADFLDQVSASLRSVDTDDTVAAEAMAELATACEEKAAALREADAQAEAAEAGEGEAAEKSVDTQAGETDPVAEPEPNGAPEPTALEVAMGEVRKSIDDHAAKVAALEAELETLKALVKAVDGKVDNAETVARRADESVQKAIHGVKAIEQRIDALPAGDGSSGGETRKSALAGSIYKD